MRRRMVLVLLATTLRLYAQTETVNGTVDNPGGSPFNGTFSITLAKSSVVNTCVTPAQVISFPGLTVKVVAGVFTATQLLPTSCLTPSIPYYVRVSDSTGKQLYSDNWYIPKVLGGTVNVGTLGSVQLASGILVSVPLAVISTPSGNQTITQPAGTSLTINNLVVSGSFSVTGTLGAGTVSATSITTSGLTVNGLSAFNGNATLGGNSLVGAGKLGIGTLSPGYSLDVENGSINTNLNYAVNGNFGTLNYCLASGGSSTAVDQWLPCLTSVTLYYQTDQANGVSVAQAAVNNFTPRFSLTSVTGATNIDLAAVGTAATCSNPSSISYDVYGRVTGCTASGTWSSGNNTYGYWEKDPIGWIRQTGTVAVGTTGTVVTFPVAFTNAASVVVTPISLWSGAGGSIAFVAVTYGSVTTTQFQVAMGVTGTQSFGWTAVGY